ncbi:DUF397 domain-containing protein [Streptomyces sp. GMY02]|uniref:DUF397 domain-containing protein n=1 Tax=Streptomyces sp. GMY02 TaxID=1333528 RepID=UPI001C2BDAA0|nr:DUF397 domain-containing protein [Streptomyces sp. GMY02]QXE39033.1 DUF397 domain-containing protein [Streptomyces sp. GMY02]
MAPEGAWYKSSYSGGTGNSCVEIADLTHCIGIRDSKDKRGPALTTTPQGWTSFIEFVRATHN